MMTVGGHVLADILVAVDALLALPRARFELVVGVGSVHLVAAAASHIAFCVAGRLQQGIVVSPCDAHRAVVPERRRQNCLVFAMGLFEPGRIGRVVPLENVDKVLKFVSRSERAVVFRIFFDHRIGMAVSA